MFVRAFVRACACMHSSACVLFNGLHMEFSKYCLKLNKQTVHRRDFVCCRHTHASWPPQPQQTLQRESSILKQIKYTHKHLKTCKNIIHIPVRACVRACVCVHDFLQNFSLSVCKKISSLLHYPRNIKFIN